ncbi:MAG: SRPBCC family protein [Myxococcota bacterium]
MVKKILIGLVALVGVFVVVVAMQPADYRVERSLAMAAPPDVVMAQIEDFKRWDAWSPWAKIDPNQKVTFGGPDKGKDATYAWSGNDEVGEGNMKITAVKPGERVDIDLNFIRPFPSSSTVDFVLKPEANGTLVTWGMNGKNDFMGKAFCLFVDMDKMLGNDFTKGLTQLKTAAEAEAAKAQAAPPPAAAPTPAEGAPAAAAEGAPAAEGAGAAK